MEQEYIDDSVRTRLIIAGISELEIHGIRDFSLRRAALLAQVSCAAPYRHFKDKDEFITEIIKYIGSKWELLCREIISVFSGDARRLVIEVSVATLRFWLANPNFRSILTAVPENSEMSSALSSLDTHLLSAIAEYERAIGTPDKTALHSYTVRALIYGTVMLISRGDLPNDETTISKIRAKLEEEFS